MGLRTLPINMCAIAVDKMCFTSVKNLPARFHRAQLVLCLQMNFPGREFPKGERDSSVCIPHW